VTSETFFFISNNFIPPFFFQKVIGTLSYVQGKDSLLDLLEVH
jgi:hypothetical protein